jgi:hypothetical protein
MRINHGPCLTIVDGVEILLEILIVAIWSRRESRREECGIQRSGRKGRTVVLRKEG